MKHSTFAIVALSTMALAGCAEQAPPPPPPPEVYVAEAIQQDVPVYTELVGQTRGQQDVEIRARVEGYLDTVAFKEGSFVRRGTLLYQIDPKPFEADVAAARAHLATMQAMLEKANNDVERYRPLVEKQAVSRQELDNALSARDAATARVDAAKAALDNALLDLGYTRITAPIDGLVGTTQIKAGNLVGRGESTLLTTVSQIDPILFRAGISEAEYLRLARLVMGEPGQQGSHGTAIELILADGSVHEFPGELDAVERAIDPTTGTLAIQARFPNPTQLLRPGQYGRARFVSEVKQGALLVPQRAVQELQNLYSVAVVGGDDTVTFRNVEVGPRVGELWVIEKGLEPGERVIVEGLQRARDGLKVNPQPVTAAAAQGTAEPTSGEAS